MTTKSYDTWALESWAVERYLHLVLIAYLLLPHLDTVMPDAQADRQNNDRPLRLPSILKLQQNLRLRLWQDGIQNMENGIRHRQVTKKIKDIIML